ncbi:MAG: hypothetical protein ACR2N2_11870 [Acidimicrobiia bacterium]
MTSLRQRLLLVAGWFAAAIGAGVVASGAVAVAGGQVLDRPLRPLTAAEVAALPVVEVGAPDAFEPHASGGLVSTTGGPTEGSDVDVQDRDDPAGTGGSTATDDSAGADPILSTGDSAFRVVSVEGGQASFSATGDRLLVLWATPQPGYIASTRSITPQRITIEFSSSLGVWVMEATLVDGAISVVSRPEPLT